MFTPGTTELIVLGVIILLIFGVRRIPEIGKGLGGALREFRNIKKELGAPEKEGIDVASDKTAEKDKPKVKNESEGKDESAAEDKSTTIEAELSKRLLERVPGVKKAMDINRKVEQVKKIIK
jgi:sec-independent protein translocase protein TatA